MNMVLHITTKGEWAAAQASGEYRAASLASEGFIHCSSPYQAVGSATRHFAGHDELFLLAIDTTRLKAMLVHEPARSGEIFAHIYGPLNLDAVTKAMPIRRGADGTFRMPEF